MDRYEVGQRVFWIARVNSPGYYGLYERLSGEIINVFNDPPIYRIKLDIVWDEKISDKSLHGKRIIVGNVMNNEISPIS